MHRTLFPCALRDENHFQTLKYKILDSISFHMTLLQPLPFHWDEPRGGWGRGGEAHAQCGAIQMAPTCQVTALGTQPGQLSRASQYALIHMWTLKIQPCRNRN